MPWLEFEATVAGGFFAESEQEARMTIRADFGKYGSVDITDLYWEEDEDDDIRG
jgi:hypothetical protein